MSQRKAQPHKPVRPKSVQEKSDALQNDTVVYLYKGVPVDVPRCAHDDIVRARREYDAMRDKYHEAVGR